MAYSDPLGQSNFYSQIRGDGWSSGNLYFTTTASPKTKIEELRDQCAPIKTERPAKPKAVTNKQLLAIVDELLAKIATQAEGYTVLRDRLDRLEKAKRSFWRG